MHLERTKRTLLLVKAKDAGFREEKMKQDDVICIVGGGSESRLAFFKNGKRVEEKRGESLNPLNQPYASFTSHFDTLLDGYPKNIAVVLGIVGAEEKILAEMVYAYFQRCGFKSVNLFSYNHLRLLGAHRGEEGVLLLAGVHSMALAYQGGRFLRRGGLGYLIGDEGGTFHLGRKGLKKAARELEEGGGLFSEKVLEHLMCRDLGELLKWIYAPERRRKDFSRLITFLLDEPAAGDLLDESARELVDLLFRLFDLLPHPLPISLGGRLLLKTQLGERVMEEAHRRNPDLRFSQALGDALDGGYYYFMKEYL